MLVCDAVVAGSEWNQNHIPIKGCVSRYFVQNYTFSFQQPNERVLLLLVLVCFGFDFHIIGNENAQLFITLNPHSSAHTQAHLYVRFIVLFVLYRKKTTQFLIQMVWHVYVLFDFG